MAESVKHFLDVIPKQTMRPGATFMTNDPWLGSGHLNDFVLVQPCFHHRKLVGLVSCTSHLIDLGGLGMGPDGSDVYDEGLIIPPMRLVEGGNINETLMALIKANSRTPFQNEGDIYALIACCDVAHTRLDQMMTEFDIDSLSAIGRYIHDVSYQASVNTPATRLRRRA
jgi:N-methylhydantoinase B